MADVLVYVAGAVLILWGAAHLAPTRRVADAFGEIGSDNRRILVMEWAAEGVTHIGVGALAVLVAATATEADVVYRSLAALLVALAVLTATTGARTPVVWFKVCPFVLTGAAALLLVRTLL